MPRKPSSPNVVAFDAGRSRLRPPAKLSELERSVFLDVVGTSRPEHFRPSDMPLLCRYCEAAALGDLAAEHLRMEGPVVGGRPSPWITVQEKAVRAMVALSMRLRLSPQARAPNTPTRRGDVPSVYDRIRLDNESE
jgi:phage terminase small subunit